ncbi:MAG: hypothetical protein J0H62_00395, partial [Rhizobiales bacterium]|nr:hypothetical protein [Hyphomicrobiales bacterium]
MANREDTKRIRKPVEFSAVAQHREGRWAKPGSYDFLAGLSQVPLADTELLLTSHHLPVVIDDVATEPRVVALTNARFQKAPIVSPTGEW